MIQTRQCPGPFLIVPLSYHTGPPRSSQIKHIEEKDH